MIFNRLTKAMTACAGLFLCACSGESNLESPKQQSHEVQASDIKPDSPEYGAVSADRSTRLPLCSSLEGYAFNEKGQADCSLETSDGSNFFLEIRYRAPANGDEFAPAPTHITVTTADGGTDQEIEEMAEFVYGLPKLQDLDADGRDDLLVPLMTGNVNTTYAVWHGTSEAGVPASKPYHRVGEIGGLDVQARADGMFSTTSRGSAMSFFTSYYKIIDGKMMEIVTAMIVLPDTDEGVETCTVSDDGGLSLINLTLAQAQSQFCDTE